MNRFGGMDTELVAGGANHRVRSSQGDADVRAKYGMGSRKYMARNRWKRARKGLLHKER